MIRKRHSPAKIRRLRIVNANRCNKCNKRMREYEKYEAELFGFQWYASPYWCPNCQLISVQIAHKEIEPSSLDEQGMLELVEHMRDLFIERFMNEYGFGYDGEISETSTKVWGDTNA